ncbi:MAG: hypothetical protein WAW71_13270, partial [Propioniciclava sp.]
MPQLHRPVAAVLAVTAGLALLTGCSTASTTASSAAGVPASGSPSGGGQQREPGTSGLIAQVSGTTLQVQGTSGQTAVTWSDATTFTQQVSGSAASITTGLCVSGMGEQADGNATVTVTRLTVTQPVDGACGQGFTGGGGGQP